MRGSRKNCEGGHTGPDRSGGCTSTSLAAGRSGRLGIPSVRDRVVQAALRLVIEPIFEQRVCSRIVTGFDRGADARTPCGKSTGFLRQATPTSWMPTLKAYFDSIPHEPLLADVRHYIADGRVLGLLEGFLKQDILEGLASWTPEEGSPQGAVISPSAVESLPASGGYGHGRGRLGDDPLRRRSGRLVSQQKGSPKGSGPSGPTGQGART